MRGNCQGNCRLGEEFPLTCTFGAADPEASEDELGTEICGWHDHQLVFLFHLPDNSSITQTLTLGPGGKRLNIATTVRTRGAGQTFTLNRVYTKFVPLPDEYECEYTLWPAGNPAAGRPRMSRFQ